MFGFCAGIRDYIATMASPAPNQALASLASLVDAIAAISGCSIVWKSRHGAVQALPQPFQRLGIHGCAFCMRVKGRRARLAQCIADDVELVMRRCDGKTRPFVKTCHAGVSELVVPLLRGSVFSGALFCGVWKARAACPYQDCGRQFAGLPLARQVPLQHLSVLMEQLGAWTVERVWGTDVPTAADPRVQKVLDRLSGEPLKAYSIPDLARDVFLSPSRLQHLFVSQVGTPLNRYLTRLRLERAPQLIVCTGLPLHAVARETGYENYAYFSTLVRRTIGLSPRRLRAQASAAVVP
jgi:AraC-like DNA-binding protein